MNNPMDLNASAMHAVWRAQAQQGAPRPLALIAQQRAPATGAATGASLLSRVPWWVWGLGLLGVAGFGYATYRYAREAVKAQKTIREEVAPRLIGAKVP